MKFRIIFFAFLLFGATLPLLAQEEGERTIEELYLQSAIRTQIIKAEANAADRDIKLIALKDIEQMLKEGLVQDNPEVINILGRLGGEGVTIIVREQGAVINDFPEVRREAARILGEVGTEEAAAQLKTILLADPEPMVMSEAIFALSKIPVEDKKKRDRTMANAMYRQTAVNKDNNFAYTFLLSIENVAEREKGVTDFMVYEEIAKIADDRNGYNRLVRERAFALLKTLQGY